jgi:tetratricopeptide (TPR) repeat protein|tara:strand:- start:912 stop:1334 length:423 start_codon:yes stop_codon:yes gene_type:complete
LSFAGKTHLLLLFVVVVASGTLLGCGKKSTNHFAIKVAKAKLWNEASFRWQQVTEEIPDAAFAHNNLGVAYEASGKIDQAILSYQKAVELEPNNKHYRYNYRRCRSIHKDRSRQNQDDIQLNTEQSTSRSDELEIDEIHP